MREAETEKKRKTEDEKHGSKEARNETLCE